MGLSYGEFVMTFLRLFKEDSMDVPNCLSKVILPNFSQGYQRKRKSKYH